MGPLWSPSAASEALLTANQAPAVSGVETLWPTAGGIQRLVLRAGGSAPGEDGIPL